MAFGTINPNVLDDPLLGFRFSVFFLGGPVGLAHPLDLYFQEVSGLGARIEMKPGNILGEEDSSRQLPGKTVYENLTLRRGMPKFSTLRAEIQASLTDSRRIARNVLVSILDENALPLNSWLFTDAFPVHWSLSSLDAGSGKVIIETMELSYTSFKPFSL
jgi:phage tail-like protein